MPIISLNQHTAIGDLANWLDARGELIEVRVTRGMSLDPGAEGVAIAVLDDLLRSGSTLDVSCTFEAVDGSGELQGPLNGLLGLFLLFGASKFGSGSSSEDSLRSTRAMVWRHIRENKGQIGSGSKRTIVFRDPDYVIPDCLRDDPGAHFPYPNRFKAVLTAMSRQVVGQGQISTLPAEDSIVSFLYEAAHNSHEHGRAAASDASGSRAAVRGIVLEKLHFTSQAELADRVAISPAVREYVSSAWKSGHSTKIFLAASVADLGPGIHRTLVPMDGEDEWCRLGRAFEPGVTRKPLGEMKGIGQGLPNILEAVDRLGGYLSISSAGLLANYVGATRASSEIPRFIGRSSDVICKDAGTSLTVIWPLSLERGAQQLLPL